MDPIEAILSAPNDTALAIIVGIKGPSYRPLGAMMAILSDTQRAGTLSSGCIEVDIALHAMGTLDSGGPKAIRYGRGSPYVDIQLPCGGGLDVLILPRPDLDALRDISRHRSMRVPRVLEINRKTGAMRTSDTGQTGTDADLFRIRFEPELQFLVFGKGPEASTFAALAHSAKYPCILLSPDAETLDAVQAQGVDTRHLTHAHLPEDLHIDPWTSVVLFFHDHDWEPPILAPALQTEAFYIGAQGSKRSRDLRKMELTTLGVTEAELARLKGPIGMIPSVRDARTLSVSVLSEILAAAMPQTP